MAKDNWIERIIDEVNRREEDARDNGIIIDGYYIGGEIYFDENKYMKNQDNPWEEE